MKYPSTLTLNSAYPKLTSFVKPAHSHVKKPFVRKTTVKNKVWVPTTRTKFPTVGSEVPTAKPIVVAVKGNRGKAVKASACWIWKPKQNQLDPGSNLNGVSGIPQDNINDKGYWDNGCSRHMTGNISYLSEYEPYNRGYVSFGHGGGKITGKGTKEDALKENVSSLRYIALPNWFHEAQMATSNDFTRIRDAFSEKGDPQKEQDRIISDTDVSESSGNTNPTVITKDPTAEQVEPVLSSTVETEVPTVSTPVPTECLSIPLVSSSGSRIISRGLEDFFGDTTDSVSSDKVEADLSNMETDIQISPTPTLRIHKVHPKSQIIGPKKQER
ncbi:hypothetical protein Tco_1567351 [Tanacetum coccineum]